MADIFAYAGLAAIATLIDTAAEANWYGTWGTGTSATASDTTITGEDEARQQISTDALEELGGYGYDDTVVMTYTMTCDSTPKTIATAGVLTASSGGTLIVKSSFTGISVVQYDEIDFTFKLRVLP